MLYCEKYVVAINTYFLILTIYILCKSVYNFLLFVYEIALSKIVYSHNTGAPRIINGILLNITGVDYTLSTKRIDPCVYQFNKSYALVCNVSGMPVPQLTWYYQRMLIREPVIVTNRTNGLLQYNIDSSTSVLVINNLTRNNTGVYYCNATNDIGFDLLTFEAIVARTYA